MWRCGDGGGGAGSPANDTETVLHRTLMGRPSCPRTSDGFSNKSCARVPATEYPSHNTQRVRGRHVTGCHTLTLPYHRPYCDSPASTIEFFAKRHHRSNKYLQTPASRCERGGFAPSGTITLSTSRVNAPRHAGLQHSGARKDHTRSVVFKVVLGPQVGNVGELERVPVRASVHVCVHVLQVRLRGHAQWTRKRQHGLPLAHGARQRPRRSRARPTRRGVT